MLGNGRGGGSISDGGAGFKIIAGIAGLFAFAAIFGSPDSTSPKQKSSAPSSYGTSYKTPKAPDAFPNYSAPAPDTAVDTGTGPYSSPDHVFDELPVAMPGLRDTEQYLFARELSYEVKPGKNSDLAVHAIIPVNRTIAHVEYRADENKLYAVTPDNRAFELASTTEAMRELADKISTVSFYQVSALRQEPDDKTEKNASYAFRVPFYPQKTDASPDYALTAPAGKYGDEVKLKEAVILDPAHKRTWVCSAFLDKKRDKENLCFAPENIIR